MKKGTKYQLMALGALSLVFIIILTIVVSIIVYRQERKKDAVRTSAESQVVEQQVEESQTVETQEQETQPVEQQHTVEGMTAVTPEEENPEVNREILYTQEEVDARINEAVLAALAQDQREMGQETEDILTVIQHSLEEGNTVMQTLRPLYPDDLIVMSDGRYHFVPISDKIAHNNYTVGNLKVLGNKEHQYMVNGQVISHKGIDVSKFQGEIDWEKVASDGVEFAFIRVLIRGYGSGKLVEDEYFEQNVEGALNAGIKVGVYVFSQAVNEEELLEEAELVLQKIEPYPIQCPVVFDVEKIAESNGRMNALTVEERTGLTKLFCDTVKKAGYQPMIYHNTEMAALMLDLEQLKDYDKWFACYSDDFYYPYDYKVWQYSEKGKVDGINTNVDLNISFAPLW